MERWLIALALLASGPARAQEPAPPPPVDELAIGEADLRMTVPVMLADAGGAPSGPWPFVIDTGAERTVLAAELARRLALEPGQGVRVTTMAGVAAVPTAKVPALRVSVLKPPAIEAPLFLRRNLGAIGMLGLDALQGHAVRIDFRANTMALRPSKRKRIVAQPGEIVVSAKSLYGQLIVTNARWRGRRIAVVLDTGTPVTIANPALIAGVKGGTRPTGAMPVIAVTGEELVAQGHLLNDVEIGSVRFGQLGVAVADAAPFRKFGLEGTPALLLGMDALRLFRSVEIDFPARSIRFRMVEEPGRF